MSKSNKETRGIISQYVERGDILGLADFARAMMEDFMLEKEELINKTKTKMSNEHKLDQNMQSDEPHMACKEMAEKHGDLAQCCKCVGHNCNTQQQGGGKVLINYHKIDERYAQ